MSESFYQDYSNHIAYQVRDLIDCEHEPITHIGSVQNGGYFLAVDAANLSIQAVSENFLNNFYLTSDEVAKKSLGDILFLAAGRPLNHQSLADLKHQDHLDVETPNRTKLIASIKHAGQTWCIDLEKPETFTAKAEYPVNDLKALVSRIDQVEEIETIGSIAAQVVREIAGFDRVMIYRFDDVWNGEVIAEARKESIEPFLGLHYPASDIPAPARKLFFENRFRMIVDTESFPVPIQALHGSERRQFDLSCSFLRATSPIHIQYLKNMGVRASFSVPIRVGGKLWGLIACHHYEKPVHLPREVRSACELAAEVISGRVSDYISKRRLMIRTETLEFAQSLLRVMADGKTPSSAFKAFEASVLALTGSTAAFIRLGGEDVILGDPPSAVTIEKVLARVKTQEVLSVWKSDTLKTDLGLAKTDPKGAGAFAVPFSLAFEDLLIWFRPEAPREVTWGGAPEDRASFMEPKTTLTPRSSFAAWTETVRDRSRPWSEANEEAAQYLLFNFVHGIFAKAAALSTANQELERLAKLKDEFIGQVSHELRTPLGVIIGWIDILRDSASNDSNLNHAIDVIDRNAKLQINLINDLLDVSRIVSGKLRLLPQANVNLSNLVKEVASGLSVTAQAKDIELRADSTIEPHITADPDRLRQIIWNLVTNAIKFTPKGGKVSVDLRKSESHYEIEVRDTGIGLPSEHLHTIFDRFAQVGPTGSRQGGLGLGLSIVKALVELHGGNIQAKSAGANKGSSFIVCLPIFALKDTGEPERDGQAIPSVQSIRVLEGIRILIVEDQVDAATALKYLVEKSGAIAHVVHDGRKALEYMTDHDASASVDLILSDIGLPEIDGLEFIRLWRAREKSLNRTITPAIALTAYASSKDRTQALSSGFQSHIPKPVDRDELIAVIQSLNLGNRSKKP